MKDEIIKPDAVAQNAMAAVKACKGSLIDKVMILVLAVFCSFGLSIEGFPNLKTNFNKRLDEIKKILSNPNTDVAKKTITDANTGYYCFLCMTEEDRIRYNSLPVKERAELFMQVVSYIHYAMQVNVVDYLFELMMYAVDTDPVICAKARALFFTLSGKDFEDYDEINIRGN